MPDMVPLILEAKAKGLWLVCSYQDLWCSPYELEANQAKGQLRFAACNWKLRDPKERLAELERGVKYAQQALADFRSKIAQAVNIAEDISLKADAARNYGINP